MQFIDLNADIGEAVTPDGQAAELAILGLISSANIACGLAMQVRMKLCE